MAADSPNERPAASAVKESDQNKPSGSPHATSLRTRLMGWIDRHGLRHLMSWEVLGLPVMTLIVGYVFWYLTPDFLTVSNLANVARQVSVLALVAWGMTAVVLTAGIDLSVGSVIALVTIFAATGMERFGEFGYITYGLAIGTGAGLINGLLIGKVGLSPFIATLGMLSVARGVALTITNGVPLFGLPDSPIYEIGRGYIGPVPTPVLFAVAGLIVMHVLLYRTRFGTYVYAVGGNEESARLAGIDVERIKILVYTLIGFLTGVGGLVLTARVRSGQPLIGDGLELEAIGAVVIGGVSLFGGVGRLSGTVWGVILIGIISNGLNLIGVSTFVQRIVLGLVIIVAVSATVVFRRRD
jgi:ribose/xylose/arabinose/galactoside ABC-type transport system permease subunit